MDRRQELIELSGQIINGIMSSNGSLLSKLFDRTVHEGSAKIVVDLAQKIVEQVDSK